MYNVYQFMDKLKSGGFTFDTKGHKFWGGDKGVTETILEKLEWFIQYYKDLQDPDSKYYKDKKTYPTEEKIQHSMWYGKKQLEFYESDKFIEVGKPMWELNKDFNCGLCGSTFYIHLLNKDTITFHTWERGNDNPINITECVFKDGIKPQKTKITVPSGKLWFSNHFYKCFEDEPEGMKYSTPYSLNYPLGRRNISDYLASQDIGYQQVGNTTVQFFMKNDGSEIIVDNYGLDYYHDSINGYETPDGYDVDFYQNIEENYTPIGFISMGVWRWMCGDEELVKSKGFEPDEYLDNFIVDVEPNSEWEITDIYNSDTYDAGNRSVVATIKRVS